MKAFYSFCPSAFTFFFLNNQWFELCNTGNLDVDMDGFILTDIGGDVHEMGGYVIKACQCDVFGKNSDTTVNGGQTVDYVYSGLTFANSEDEIRILDKCGSLIDEVHYGSLAGLVSPPPAGASIELSDVSLDNMLPGSWATSVTEYGNLQEKGTPGTYHFIGSVCPASPTMPPTSRPSLSPTSVPTSVPSAPTSPPTPSRLVVTEFMSNPATASDSAGEVFIDHCCPLQMCFCLVVLYLMEFFVLFFVCYRLTVV